MLADRDDVKQWRRACVSPHAIVILANGEQQRRIPSAFLRRSVSLRTALADQEWAHFNNKRRKNKQETPCCYDGLTVRMDDVDVPTFELFFEWSLMLHPALRDHWTMEQILQLAQVSQIYKVFGLKNQVASRLRECLLSKQWRVTPELVSGLWQMSSGDPDSGLYLILSVSLGAIPDQTATPTWRTVMENHTSLYQLHSDACLHKFTVQTLEEIDICELHDHSWNTVPRIRTPGTCHLQRGECFPKGWFSTDEKEEGRALCHLHHGSESTLAEDWQGVVQCDPCEVQSDRTRFCRCALDVVGSFESTICLLQLVCWLYEPQ